MSSRSKMVKQLPCIACQIEGRNVPCGPTEEHHLNLGGHAGQKRLGNEYSIPLGPWHHRGDPPQGMTASEATYHYGPSLARSSKRFRETYGADLFLLGVTDEALKGLT